MVMISILPVRSPLPNSVPSTLSAPAITASSGSSYGTAAVVMGMHTAND